jgi:hypothetical protein
MPRSSESGRTWSRPEALDVFGRLPGRRMRWFGSMIGIGAIVTGAYLGLFSPVSSSASPQFSTAASEESSTCASVGITLAATKIPAEGIVENSVIRLTRIDAMGDATLLVPQAYVLAASSLEAGALQVSVLVRIDSGGNDLVEAVNGSSADNSLAAAVLYDVDAVQVLDECRQVM